MVRFLVVLLLLYFVFRWFSSMLFGFSPKHKQQRMNQQARNQNPKSSATTPSKTKKIIAPNEGEYVDYEEIKD